MQKLIILLNVGPTRTPSDEVIRYILKNYLNEFLKDPYTIVTAGECEKAIKLIKKQLKYTGRVIKHEDLKHTNLNTGVIFDVMTGHVADNGTTLFVVDTETIGRFITTYQTKYETFPLHTPLGFRVIDYHTHKLIQLQDA